MAPPRLPGEGLEEVGQAALTPWSLVLILDPTP